MSQITVCEYYMGRDSTYADLLIPDIRQGAEEIVRRVNLLLARAGQDGVEPGLDQVTGTPVASGWRPPAVNDRTKNAAAGSTHLTGEGVDLQDHPDRRLARWCLAHTVPACKQLGHKDELAAIGLWMEDPRWTGGRGDPWVHLQMRPPKSGKRVYIPSSAPPSADPLPEQQA